VTSVPLRWLLGTLIGLVGVFAAIGAFCLLLLLFTLPLFFFFLGDAQVGNFIVGISVVVVAVIVLCFGVFRIDLDDAFENSMRFLWYVAQTCWNRVRQIFLLSYSFFSTGRDEEENKNQM